MYHVESFCKPQAECVSYDGQPCIIINFHCLILVQRTNSWKLELDHFNLPTDTSLEKVKPRCSGFKLVSELPSLFPEMEIQQHAYPVSHSMVLMTMALDRGCWDGSMALFLPPSVLWKSSLLPGSHGQCSFPRGKLWESLSFPLARLLERSDAHTVVRTKSESSVRLSRRSNRKSQKQMQNIRMESFTRAVIYKLK